MNVAKWLLSGLLALPLMELVAFIVVAALIGFGWALVLILAGSAVGFLILRHAGGNHIERVRVAVGNGNSPRCAQIALSVLSCWPEFCFSFRALSPICWHCSCWCRRCDDWPPRVSTPLQRHVTGTM